MSKLLNEVFASLDEDAINEENFSGITKGDVAALITQYPQLAVLQKKSAGDTTASIAALLPIIVRIMWQYDARQGIRNVDTVATIKKRARATLRQAALRRIINRINTAQEPTINELKELINIFIAVAKDEQGKLTAADQFYITQLEKAIRNKEKPTGDRKGAAVLNRFMSMYRRR